MAKHISARWILTLTQGDRRKKLFLAVKPKNKIILTYFLISPVIQVNPQKYLWNFFNAQLDFKEHLSIFSDKFVIIELFRNLQSILPRPCLLIIYKLLVRPFLDYWDIIMIKRIMH